MEELREYVKKLESSLNMTNPIVDDSVEHAKLLRDLGNTLKNYLQNTAKFANTALRATRVYKNIVDAVGEALEAAKMAYETADTAKRKVWFPHLLNADVVAQKCSKITYYIENFTKFLEKCANGVFFKYK